MQCEVTFVTLLQQKIPVLHSFYIRIKKANIRLQKRSLLHFLDAHTFCVIFHSLQSWR